MSEPAGAPATTPNLIGPYRIERELARGGMGIVYLARDTRLNRVVALKALPEEVASDQDRLQRFEREAKLLASVNHPNVATIFGIETSGKRRYLALEYIEGESLAARLIRGPISIDETLELGAQIAAGVEAAHEAGIIHRDLKPANVVVTSGDRLKVVDFGLARGREGDAAVQENSPAITPSSPTVTQPAEHSPTMPGVILGTAPYLSPEQARGKAVDRRTDIWSFGCVLYECLTGSTAFRGETVSDTIALILTKEPDWAKLPPATPAALVALMKRCLVKDPRRRLRDIGEARLALEDIRSGGSEAPVVAPRSSPQAPPRPWYDRLHLRDLIVGILGFLVAAAFWNLVLGKSTPRSARDVTRLSVQIPADLRVTSGSWITADGRTIVLSAIPRQPGPDGAQPPRIYVRRLDQTSFEPLRGTDGLLGFVVSRDSKWVEFISSASDRSFDPQIFKMPVDGSAPPVFLTRAADTWGRPIFLESGDQLFPLSNGKDYVRLPANGGPPSKPISLHSEGAVTDFSDVLPGDRGVLVTMRGGDASSFRQDVGVFDLKSGRTKQLIADGGSPMYSPSGYLVFSRGGTLLAVRFDSRSLETKGQPVAIMDGLRVFTGLSASPFVLARSGTLVYMTGGDMSGRQAIVVSPDGHVSEWSPERQPFQMALAVSPDGARFASQIQTGGRYEVWTSSRGGDRARRLVAVPGSNCGAALWSPDGRKIAYLQEGGKDQDGIYVVDADGNGEARRIAKVVPGDVRLFPTSWSPDGRVLLATKYEGYRGALCAIDIDAGDSRAPRPLFGGTLGMGAAVFAPNGRALAYVSDESGREEVYLSSWDSSTQATVGAPLSVSRGGGSSPVWSRDGKRIYFITPENKIDDATVATSATLSTSPPATAWDMDALGAASGFWGGLFDIMPDGSLLTIRRAAAETEVSHFEIALNFDQELRAKVGK
jgi:serine/threonine protein kinase/Tol biopolymer transport system component